MREGSDSKNCVLNLHTDNYFTSLPAKNFWGVQVTSTEVRTAYYGWPPDTPCYYGWLPYNLERRIKIKQKRSKYKARKTIVDDIVFHSAAEANRYKILQILEKSGHIKHLKLQVPFDFFCIVESSLDCKKMFTYYADFTYQDKTGQLIIEDVKGMKMAVYRLKKKLIEAHYGITITEVK